MTLWFLSTKMLSSFFSSKNNFIAIAVKKKPDVFTFWNEIPFLLSETISSVLFLKTAAILLIGWVMSTYFYRAVYFQQNFSFPTAVNIWRIQYFALLLLRYVCFACRCFLKLFALWSYKTAVLFKNFFLWFPFLVLQFRIYVCKIFHV